MQDPIAAALIDSLHAGADVPQGCRVNHARGLLVEGRFRAAQEATRICNAPVFDGADQPLIVRFSDSGPDPAIAQDSPEAEPRGLALRIGRDSQLVLVGHSLEGFPASDPQTFLAFVQALNAAQTTPESLHAHLTANAAALRFGQLRENARPAGYASRTYHMLHPYRLTDAQGGARIGRLTVKGGNADGGGRTLAGADCLDEALRQALERGPVTLELVFTPTPEQAVADDLSAAWPDSAASMLLGHLMLERLSRNQDAQHTLVFDPSVLPAALEFAGDPMLAARLQAYRLAAARRLGCPMSSPGAA